MLETILLSSEYTGDFDALGMHLHLDFQSLYLLRMGVNSGYLEGHTRSSLNHATVKFYYTCVCRYLCVRRMAKLTYH